MKCTYLRSCLLGNFSFFFLGFLPNLQGLLRFAFSQVLEAKSRISFCKEKGNSFLPSVEQATHWGATSLVTPLFCAYSLFVERNSWITLECCCPNLCGHHSQLSPAPLSVLASVRSEFRQPLVCGYCFYPQQPHPFQFSSHHIGKLICLPRQALAVWYGSRSSWWVRIR